MVIFHTDINISIKKENETEKKYGEKNPTNKMKTEWMRKNITHAK